MNVGLAILEGSLRHLNSLVCVVERSGLDLHPQGLGFRKLEVGFGEGRFILIRVHLRLVRPVLYSAGRVRSSMGRS